MTPLTLYAKNHSGQQSWCDEVQEARLLLETQKEGYFNNDHLLGQVECTINIFERVHPQAKGLFLFDNAPSHRKLAEDALNVNRINVHPGGKQPVMRNTKWNGQVQPLIFDDGTPKGMKAILEERGVETKGMKGAEMSERLKSNADFQAPKTLHKSIMQQLFATLCLCMGPYSSLGYHFIIR